MVPTPGYDARDGWFVHRDDDVKVSGGYGDVSMTQMAMLTLTGAQADPGEPALLHLDAHPDNPLTYSEARKFATTILELVNAGEEAEQTRATWPRRGGHA